MDRNVTVSGCTVISVRHKANKSAKLHWWIAKSSKTHEIHVTGIPAYVREESLRRIFSNCGAIKTICIQPLNGDTEKSHLPKYTVTKGYQRADIEFNKLQGVKKALSMKYDGDYTLCDQDSKLEPMVQVWVEDLRSSYNINTATLQEKCTSYMRNYDLEKSKEEKSNRKMADEPDEDGWITVTRNKFSRPPKAVKAHELKSLKKKKNATAILHFYKNQVNDSKMQKIRELKAKFEEDKKRIQEMRQQRKFRPY